MSTVVLKMGLGGRAEMLHIKYVLDVRTSRITGVPPIVKHLRD